MAGILTNDEHYYAIANAIRAKLHVETKYRPIEMPPAIMSISGGENVQPVTFNQNGTYTLPENTIYNPITVSVHQDVTGEEINITSNGTYLPPAGKMYSKVNVSVQTEEESDVMFYDYDGSLEYSYSQNAFLALSEMPEEASHPGLVSEGWNWNLNDAKVYVNEYGGLAIGQSYTTDNGETRFYININDPDGEVIALSFYQSKSYGVSVNWGEPSMEDPVAYENEVFMAHRYETPGQYVIALFPAEDCELTFNRRLDADDNPIYTLSPMTALYKIEFGRNVFSLGAYAFTRAFSLETVSIPSTITWFDSSVFSRCVSLKGIVLPVGKYASIDDGKDEGKDEWSEEGSEEGKDEEPEEGKDEEVPDSFHLGDYVFWFCSNLKNVSFPPSMWGIGLTALSQTKIKKAYLSNELTNIGSYSFADCESLELVVIPNQYCYISNSAFNNCYNLKAVYLSDDITTLQNEVFGHCYLLNDFEFPSELTSIGYNAFIECASLVNVDIPEGVTSIGSTAFKDCDSLRKVILPSTLRSIGNGAFAGSNLIQEFHVKATTPPTLGTDALETNGSFVVYVPSGYLSAYMNDSGWSQYRLEEET